MASQNSTHVMSNREFETFMKNRKLEAYKACDPLVQEFVACSRNRVFSVLWACSEQSKRMKDCIRSFAEEKSVMAAGEEYLRTHRRQV
ncbi:COX assembly mitochondrial protein 1 [Malassezia restricta]|uniref:COX assembly mitochondrial protein n=1 Tax=Malassezia restricta (strain ATCC 96810 / NBRC 103918 / CBS 7877) TaxID=425264 RepID=A0A3G2S080_MALR7|nr:COX assembly mitochondrial protein 1 [Malassezia restricta]AXA48485.1 COX assembly mitochondrial protein 1 [Malassezia restricta]AYO41364.1 COX assembly mitochondrial protein 2 [Malassezia restricta CBS 7877]